MIGSLAEPGSAARSRPASSGSLWKRLVHRIRFRWQQLWNGADAASWDRVVRAYHARGMDDAVVATTRSLVARGLHVPESVVRSLSVERQRGRPVEALGLFAELPEVLRRDSDVLREAAAAHLDAGNSYRAGVLAREILETKADDPGAYGVLLLAFCAEGRFLEAARSIAGVSGAALECEWALEVVLRGLADERPTDPAERREIDRAIRALGTRSNIEPLALGRWRRFLGDHEGAAKIFYRLLEDPEHDPVPVRLEICRLALDTGRLHEHIGVLTTVVARREAPAEMLRELESSAALECELADFYRRSPDVTPDYRVPDAVFEMMFLGAPRRSLAPGQLDVALIGATLGAGGAEKVLCNAFLGLREARPRRCQMWIQSLDPKHGHDFFWRDLELEEAAGGACRHLPPDPRPAPPFSWLPFDTGRNASAAHRAINQTRPRVVHAWQDSTNLEVAFAAVRAGVPRIVVHPHNMQPDLVHDIPIAGSFRRAYQALLQRPDVHLVCVSEASLADYLRWLGIERNGRHHVVYNGFRWPAGSTEPARRRRRRALRAELGIPEDRVVVGGMFRVVPIKRVGLWLEVARTMIRLDPRLTFVLFGDGPDLPAVRRKVDREGLGDRIRLMGTVRRAAEKCAAFDLLLHTSSSEGLPTVLLEAQANGVPVVAADVGGVAETLDGTLGALVPEARVDRFVAAVRRTLDRGAGPAERAGLCRFVRRRFGVDRMVADLERIYEL